MNMKIKSVACVAILLSAYLIVPQTIAAQEKKTSSFNYLDKNLENQPLASMDANKTNLPTESTSQESTSQESTVESAIEQRETTETTYINETETRTESSHKDEPDSKESNYFSEKLESSSGTKEKTNTSTNEENDKINNSGINTKQTNMYKKWKYTETANNTCRLELYIPTSMDEVHSVTVPNEINGKQTEIDLSHGLPIDTSDFLDPPLEVDQHSLVFENTNNKKVKVISNNIGTLNFKSIDARGLDVSNVTSLERTFASRNIHNVNLSGWDTSNVVSMKGMFQDAGHPLSSSQFLTIQTDTILNTSKVKDMSYMFENTLFEHNYPNLLPVLSKLLSDITSVEYMQYMFSNTRSKIPRLISDFSPWWSTSYYFFSLFRDKGTNNVVKDMSYMFYTSSSGNEFSPRSIDLTAFSDLTKTNIEKMFFVPPNTQSEDKTLVIYSDSMKLKESDFKKDNRISAPTPVFDTNGGYFQDGALEKNLNSFVYPITSALTVSNVIEFSKKNIPQKEGYLFNGWKVEAPPNYFHNVYELTDPNLNNYYDVMYMRYKAQWKKDDFHQPSKNDNTKPIQTGSLSIAYMPKLFTIKAKLHDSGKQSIPIPKDRSYHIGVRDRTNSADSWKLQAQLIWEDKPILGGTLKIKNPGIVKKNLNDGTSQFNPDTDFASANNEVTGAINPTIETDAPSLIMEANKTTKNAIYDYELNELTFDIEDTSKVEPRIYTGNVNWNILKVP